MRFSKQTLANDLWKMVKHLQEKHNFSTGNGWKQVEGMKTPTIVNYGEWSRLRAIMDSYDLWKLIPQDQFTGIGVFGMGPVKD